MINWLAVVVTALVPMVVGFIYYNPKVMGTAWMKAADMTEEKMEGANMPLIFGVSFVLAFLLALAMNPLVIHQFGVFSIFSSMPDFAEAGSESAKKLEEFMAAYGSNDRNFGHGAFHGLFYGIMIALPILGTNALFERKGFKYIGVNGLYWIITFAIMGGIIAAWQ